MQSVVWETQPHKGLVWAHDHTLLFSFEKHHFWRAVAQITNTYSSHLENVPTSLPAIAPELDTEQGLQCPPHRLHCALSMGHSKSCHCHHPNAHVDPRPSSFPVEIGTKSSMPASPASAEVRMPPLLILHPN